MAKKDFVESNDNDLLDVWCSLKADDKSECD